MNSSFEFLLESLHLEDLDFPLKNVPIGLNLSYYLSSMIRDLIAKENVHLNCPRFLRYLQECV